ncbi:hypothetical protein [Vulgatibacter sp.]|uniref:hypothetical protein n=1 Tax=Vulgatibacter sp. TaxID=1971226 RepID=UPI003566566A
MRLLLLAIALILLAPAPAAAQAIAARYAIEATVSKELDEIRGALEVRVENTGDAPLDRLVLWLYPNLFSQEIPGITDVNRTFYEPFGPSSGGIRIDGLQVGRQPVETRVLQLEQAPPETARAIDLPVPLQPGESALVTLDFVTTVPHRLGPLSRAKGVLTALGGWHPWITVPASRPVQRQPAPADFRVRLHTPGDHVALIGGANPGGDGTVELTDRPWLDLVVRPKRHRPLRTRGGAVWPLEAPPHVDWDKNSQPDPRAFSSDYTADDIARLLGRLDRWGDAQPGLPDPGPIHLVVVPLRSEIALATPGIVAVSDRAFGVTPVELLQDFHAAGIARAYFARRFLPLVQRCESPAVALQIADGLGALYADRFAEEVLGGTSDARGILATFDFLPNVDDFLRSPKAAFPHVYFSPVADPIPVRDEPWTFANGAPRGKVLFAKLQDWLGPEAFRELIEGYLAGAHCPLQRGAEGFAEQDLDAFFRTWTERRPSVDLRVRILSTEKRPDGKWESVVEVRRVGDAPPELVETLAWEENGEQHLLTWPAQKGEAAETFTIVADRRITRLRVDPRGRVHQTPAEPGEITAVGDRVPARIQLLLTRAAVSYSAADNSFFGDIDFLLRPRDAVRRRLSFGGSYRKARLEVRTALSFGFGPLVDAARYAWNWGVGLSGDYLRAGFGGEDTEEGFAVGPSVGISYDDRPAASNPLRGTAFATGFSFSAGANRGGASTVYGGASAAWLRLFPLGPRSTLAVRLKGNVLLGDPPIQELIPLGGSDEGLRGFPLESVLAQQRAVASAEWRHPLLPDLDVDLGLARLRQVAGAVFFDGAFAGEIFPLLEETPADGLFADAGYGLRFEYDVFGVRPLFLAVDAAVPINTRGVDTPPIVFSLRAGQAFAGL